MSRSRFAVPLCCVLLLAAFPARTPAVAGAPSCDATRVGGVAAMAGKRCICRYERGGTMTGRKPGFRWDCGILRPADRFAPAVPREPAPDWLGPVIVDQRPVRP